MSCEFAHDDGAYVLGALSPTERSAYQAHLAGCDECTRAVQELAGLPGLLARVPADVLEQPDPEPLPETMLPALVREVQRAQRRRTWTMVGTAAAAAVIVGGGSLAVGLNVGDDDAPPSAAPPVGQAMDVGRPRGDDRGPRPDRRLVGHPPRPDLQLPAAGRAVGLGRRSGPTRCS